MILSNSPVLGSRGIFTDCAMHTPPAGEACQQDSAWRRPALPTPHSPACGQPCGASGGRLCSEDSVA